MQYDIPPGADPARVYGTPEFERARLSKWKPPVRCAIERDDEMLTPAEALARYRAARARLRGERPSVPKVAPPIPVVEAPAAPLEPYGPPTHLYLKWMSRSRIYVTEIIKATVLHFESCFPDVVGASRHAVHIFPRHIAIYLARTLTNRTLPEIGVIFGGRDHSTILHAVRRIQSLIDAGDERVISDIAAIRARLDEGDE